MTLLILGDKFMRLFWLVLALSGTMYVTLPPSWGVAIAWQFINEMWQQAELTVGQHSELLNLIQAAKLVIF